MLLHFSGLLSLSFASGIDFLVKGCISIIMAILNLCAFEEGDMVALRSLLDSGSQSVTSELSPDKVTKVSFVSVLYAFFFSSYVLYFTLQTYKEEKMRKNVLFFEQLNTFKM
jgi:hypothetical protein